MGPALPEKYRLDFDSGRPLVVEIESGTSVEGLFRELPWLGRPFEEIIVVSVNGQQQELDYVLQPGDVLDIIIPAAGG
jgi:molybdopterin converting factor small subunit